MNQNQNEKKHIGKTKGALVTGVFCFVVVLTLVGTLSFRTYQKRNAKHSAKAELVSEQMNGRAGENAFSKEMPRPKLELESPALPQEEMDSFETAADANRVWFDENSTLGWPVEGDTLIDYSMDKTTYFPTLEQYKYNPAMIIGGEAGENVTAAQEGIVAAVEQNAQTGVTVTLDMGNGYTARYGQLEGVTVEEGAYVNKGQVLGHLAEPTKYYSVEGPNLYFGIQKDGAPVDPGLFLEERKISEEAESVENAGETAGSEEAEDEVE